MLLDSLQTADPPRACRVCSRVAVFCLALAIIAAGFAIGLNARLSPSREWVEPALLITCVALVALAVASSLVAQVVKAGWYNVLITALAWAVGAGVLALAITAYTFLSPHIGSLADSAKIAVVAAAHIFGAVIATFVLGIFLSRGIALLQARRIQRRLKEAAIALGIPFEELYVPTNLDALTKYFNARFTSELLRNRISDFLGQVLRIWGWFGMLLQVVLLAWVIFATVTDGASNAPYAWFVLVLEVLFDAIAFAAGFVCRLLTGREPGQAHRARQVLYESVRTQSYADVG